MEYEQLASFAQTWGLIYFMSMFLLVLAYVLWPQNKAEFDEAAEIPLRDTEQ